MAADRSLFERRDSRLRRTRLRESRRRHLERVASAGRSETVTEKHYLLDALDRLPERQRAAVILAYYGGYRARDIAEALDCRIGTAKSLVHRGVAALRKEIRA